MYCVIILKPALSIIIENMPDLNADLDRIKKDANRHGYFPDGTLFIEGENTGDRVWEFIRKNGLLSCGVGQPTSYRSLTPFPDKIHMLYFTRDYSESLGDLGFVAAFPGIGGKKIEDFRIDNLLITVVFYKTLGKELKTRFATYLGDWFKSVSFQGLSGEGPIKPTGHHIEFRGRIAQFRMDVSQSGQDTLNWLLVSTLNFAHEFIPVTDFIFDNDGQIERFIGPIKASAEYIEIASSNNLFTPNDDRIS